MILKVAENRFRVLSCPVAQYIKIIVSLTTNDVIIEELVRKISCFFNNPDFALLTESAFLGIHHVHRPNWRSAAMRKKLINFIATVKVFHFESFNSLCSLLRLKFVYYTHFLYFAKFENKS